MGTSGAVSGDCFVKVAYEEPRIDDIGREIPGKVRILPLNSAYCLPVDDTEILTRRGWVSADDLTTEDQVLALDPESDEMVWTDVQAVNIFDWDGPMHRFESERFSALSTPDHRWVFQTKRGQRHIRTSEEIAETAASGALVLAGGAPVHFPTEAKYTDEFVELVGWVVTEGGLEPGSAGFSVYQNAEKNSAFAGRIQRLHTHYGGTYSYTREETRTSQWRFPAHVGHEVRSVLTEGKGISPDFLTALTLNQATLLYNTLLDGDGDTRRSRGEYLWADSEAIRDSFQMLAMMLGKRSQAYAAPRTRSYDGADTVAGSVTVYQNRLLWQKDMKQSEEHYTGRVWCPTTGTGTWVARRKEVMQDGGSKKVIYLTGNCFP